MDISIEYEAKFIHIEKDSIRKRLKNIGAQLIKPEFVQRRVIFHLPKGQEVPGGRVRVRDEGDKITMSLKATTGTGIEDQKEICLEVNDFDQAKKFVESLGCKQKAFQESKRELWHVENAEVTIDEWPFLEPFVEIEAPSKEDVEKVSELLGFDYSQAIFGAIDTLYKMKYNIDEDIINNHTPVITFSGANPFLVQS